MSVCFTPQPHSPVSPLQCQLCPCSNITCVPPPTSPVSPLQHHLCAPSNITCVPAPTSPVSPLQHHLCPRTNITCVPAPTSPVSPLQHHLCPRFIWVKHLGPKHTCYSSIWPDMDPVHTSSSPSRLKFIKGTLQQHEAQFAAATTEARQIAAHQGQVLNAMTAQIIRLTNTITLPTPAVGQLPHVPVPLSLWPHPEPRVGTTERYAGDPEAATHFSWTVLSCSPLSHTRFPSKRLRWRLPSIT